jgi:hypothetical protein
MVKSIDGRHLPKHPHANITKNTSYSPNVALRNPINRISLNLPVSKSVLISKIVLSYVHMSFKPFTSLAQAGASFPEATALAQA